MKIVRKIIPWPLRQFDTVRPLDARTVSVSNQVLVQCCSTQYLGIPWTLKSERAFAKLISGTNQTDWGSFGSNFLGGTHESRLALENEIASKSGYPAALAFASGWAANYALGEVIGRVCDLVVSDRRSHNSVIHGLRAGKTKPVVADLQERGLQTAITNLSFKNLGVFSPSLEGITGQHVSPKWKSSLRKRALWIRDDCHSFGAIGHFGTEDFDGQRPDVRVLGLSKACGVMGAVVCGPTDFINTLAQLASPWIFSTAVPPIMWKMSLAAFKVVRGMAVERRKILALAETFRNGLNANDVRTSGHFHITGVHIPVVKARGFEAAMRRAGYYLKLSQYPTRPIGNPCTRVCFTPKHTLSDAIDLRKSIVKALRK